MTTIERESGYITVTRSPYFNDFVAVEIRGPRGGYQSGVTVSDDEAREIAAAILELLRED